MDNKLKICVYGKMRSGKSEVVKYLQKKFNADVFDFGDPLKDVVKIINPQDRGRKNRRVLQTVGQHMREMDPMVWIKATDYNMKRSDKKTIICTGCRQPNEYDYLNKMAFLFIKVVADEDVRRVRMIQAGDTVSEKEFHHKTEQHLDDFYYDIVIFNNSNSFLNLHKQIDDSLFTLQEILTKKRNGIHDQIKIIDKAIK